MTPVEYLILCTIHRLRIAWSVVLAWLCGQSDYSYCRKRLRKLVEQGLVQTVWDARGRLCYYLTGTGLRSIGKGNTRPYEPSYTTNHALLVGLVCAWLHIRDGTNVEDMATDAQLQQFGKGGEHRPDIVVGEDAYEVELNHKSENRLTNNILSNDKHYASQTWIVPDHIPSIAGNLRRCANRLGVTVNICYLSEIEKAVIEADIHQNKNNNNKEY